jgi:DNA-binding NarL/FixJ family response regulator
MLSLIGFIPSILTFLTGLSGVVGKVSDNIKELEIKKQQVKSDEALKQIDAEIAEQHERATVLVAEAGSRINGTIRAIIALGPALYVLKYFAFDKVIGSIDHCASGISDAANCWMYRTDGLNPEMTAVLTACIGFYFLSTSFGKK